MGSPPSGGSRAIWKLRPSRLVAGPYNDDDGAVQRGIWRWPTLISRRFEDSLLPRTQVLRTAIQVFLR